MSATKPCQHLQSEFSPEVLFVLDQHLEMTDGFVRCLACDAHYLLETVDIAADASLFRVSILSADAVAKTVRSLTRGSCDISRAKNEVFSLASHAQRVDGYLLKQSGQWLGLVRDPEEMEVPNRSWRELPCDGTLLGRVR